MALSVHAARGWRVCRSCDDLLAGKLCSVTCDGIGWDRVLCDAMHAISVVSETTVCDVHLKGLCGRVSWWIDGLVVWVTCLQVRMSILLDVGFLKLLSVCREVVTAYLYVSPVAVCCFAAVDVPVFCYLTQLSIEDAVTEDTTECCTSIQ